MKNELEYSHSELVDIFTESFTVLHKYYKWYGSIYVDLPEDLSKLTIDLDNFDFFIKLWGEYTLQGYDTMVLIDYLHALLCKEIKESYNNFFQLHMIINYKFKDTFYIKEIDSKSIKYKIKLKK